MKIIVLKEDVIKILDKHITEDWHVQHVLGAENKHEVEWDKWAIVISTKDNTIEVRKKKPPKEQPDPNPAEPAVAAKKRGRPRKQQIA